MMMHLNFNELKIKFITFLLSFVVVIGMNINLDKKVLFIEFFYGNNIINIILIYFIFYILNKAFEIKDRKVKIYSLLLSVLIGLIEIIGYSFNNYNDFSNFINAYSLLKNVLKFISIFTLCYSFFVLILTRILNNDFVNKIVTKYRKNTFIFIFAIILLFWIPYLILYYPGIVSYDSIVQIQQALNVIELSNAHPVLHTLIIKFWIYIGTKISDVSFGIFLYSLFQMIIMAMIFSYSICYLIKLNVSKKIIIIVSSFIILFPINALYSITIWKDILFSGVLLLFVIYNIELSKDYEAFFKENSKVILYIIVAILLCLLRNNGFYIILLFFPILLIFLKTQRRKIFLVYITVVLFYLLYTGPILSIFNVKPANMIEAFSIPLQHMARVESKYELNEYEKKMYESIFIVDNIGDYYNPRLSDPVKGRASLTFIKENLTEFIKFWVSLSWKYPRELLESYINNSFGYWYPRNTYWIAKTVGDENEFFEQKNFIPSIRVYTDRISDIKSVPIVSTIYSIGFWFIVFVFSLSVVCIKKQYKAIIPFIPLIILWLTCTASPVYSEYRYIYALIISTPILLALSLSLNKNTL